MMCINCNRKLNEFNPLIYIFKNSFYKCWRCKKIQVFHVKELGVSWYSLFYYKNMARICVIRSKTSKRDIMSKFIKKTDFFKKYKNHLWIPAPSTDPINHLTKTLEALNVDYIDCMKKVSNIRQSSLSLDDRKKIKLSLINIPRRRKIVLFDDTSTSGFTLRHMAKLLGSNYEIVIFSFCVNKYT